ncbi:ABC transporter permease [Gracilibacillus massiliensis]|uniref:ABC transporter permease n=1 Tax=Gracilibacillus massiliensis TaxID=1564956 RepID=UPI00071D45ED|nr:ABC transporter permease [Gracilibacillus massiliensis]
MNTLTNNAFVNIFKENKGIIAVLIILFVALSIISPVFLTANNIITLFLQITINMFLALGMTYVIILGGIDLSVGAIVAMSGTITVGLMVNSGLPVVVAVLIGLALGALIGLLNGTVITQFGIPPFIVTLATMYVGQGIAYIYSGGRSLRVTEEAFTQLGTARLFDVIPISIIYMAVFILLFSIVLMKTRFGTSIYAMGGNREAARLSGIRTKRVEIAVYTLIGFMSAFAGIVLAARMYSGQPSVGQGYELDAIAACVLGGVSMAGGKGRISGTVFGAIVIGVVSNGLNLMGVISFWQLLVMGLIILIAVIIDSQKGKKLPFNLNFLNKNNKD